MTFTAPATPRGRYRRQSAIGANRADLPPIHVMADHILSVYWKATRSERRQGLTWYADAREVAAEVARVGDLPTVRHGAGVLAALSPQTDWHSNIGLAFDAAVAGTADDLPHFADACDKATAVLSASDQPENVLGGRKVRSFYANIYRPDRPGPVTVDRHAVAIALRGAADSDRRSGNADARLLERIGTYQCVAAAFRGAARSVGIHPHEMQAVTWVTWRRLTGADAADRTNREEF